MTLEAYVLLNGLGMTLSKDSIALSGCGWTPASQPRPEIKQPRSGKYGALELHDGGSSGDMEKFSRSGAGGPAPNMARFYREPKTYLAYAILVTIFCCAPLGIPAIYFSSKARKLSSRGFMTHSHRAAVKSRQLIQMALSIGLVWWFVTLIVIIIVTHPQPL